VKKSQRKSRPASPKKAKVIEFSIDEEFKTLLPPLPPEDFEKLERSILEDGCRDPVVIWKEEKILIDGQNRYDICTKHNLPYGIIEKSFDNREQVKVWMLKNQLLRRNMNLFQRAEAALKFKDFYASMAKENQRAAGGRAVRPKWDKPVDTLQELANLAGTSRTTIHRVEYILSNLSASYPNNKKFLDALRRDDPGISISGAYESLQEFLGTKKTAKSVNKMFRLGKLEPKDTSDIASYPEKLVEKVNAALNRLDFVSDKFEDRKYRQYILDSVEEWLIDRHKKFNNRKEDS
jgi:hypothetical protein